METLHIKLEADEAINSKRKLLYAEINLLKLVKRIESYKKLRALELRSKAVLKTELRKVLEEIRILERKLPETKIKKAKGIKTESIGKAARTRLERELKEIREELERLG